MPKLQFDVTFDARADSPAAHHGWTYHHVLPWRYYYLMGYVIGNVARMKYLRQNYTIKEAGLKSIIDTEKARSENELTKEFGPGVEAFHRNLNESGPKLLRLLGDLHGRRAGGRNSVVDRLNMAGGFDLGAIGNLCSAPRFGGFYGIAPEHRCDDLGDQPERHKPRGADAKWWDNLKLLRAHLEGFCNNIGGASAGATIRANVDYQDFPAFLTTVRILAASHNTTYDMNCEDWRINVKGSHTRKSWAYIDGVVAPQPRLSRAGKVFELRSPHDREAGTRITPEQVDDCDIEPKVYSPARNERKNLAWFV